MFCRLVYDLLPSGEWWDTIPADSDRWGARKFTIGPNGSRKRPDGKSTSCTGDVYEGEFQKDDYHGRGKMTFAGGGSYDGEFQSALFHGRGKQTYAEGFSYDGEWADGKKHGIATFTYPDGRAMVSCYEARWCRHGAGRRLECGPDEGVGNAGRPAGERHLAGRGGQDRRAHRAAAALRLCSALDRDTA